MRLMQVIQMVACDLHDAWILPIISKI